ncbi:esterase-like activity of phytase family protein [Diaphorobacter sp.]|uniref:esterase-like activity of phytase family protein n=1 Tax=Diaphorobacter sp. TaxID=1934310 RepID=UPI003D105A96
MKKSAIALAVGVALSGLLAACGGSDDGPADVPSVSNPNKFFNRTATFAVCAQVGSSCEDSTPTAAEIVAASEDGMTLVYTNSLKGEVGFVDIVDPAAPKALGKLAMGGEPTSVTVLGSHALVAVNTSANFINASGKLVVVDIAKRSVVTEIQLGGQPDSVARSKDGKYVAVVIENERDESVNKGALPQAPSGYLTIVDTVGAPATWKTRNVELKGLATLYPEDAEPEYVSINDDNVAVVTLQENNHIALVDLPTGKVTRHFSAGAVTLTQVDLTDAPRPNSVNLTETQANRLREPDGVTWLSKAQFATANEGDLNGGSRGFTIFNTDGTVAYDAGNTLEHLVARIGHTNDKRSDAKGNEPENVAFGRFDGTDYLFVASERSSVLAVYDMGQKNQPVFKQVLPAALAPEGVLAIPSRNLLIAASENDDRATNSTLRSALNIYQYQSAPAAYPTIQSVNRAADGTPIPWSALSGLAAAPTGSIVYGIDDSFFRGNRIFEIDTSTKPASLKREIRITDPNGKIAALAATLPAAKDANAFDATDLAALVNADGSVNLDPEGISLASAGGFWIASEGAGTVGDAARPVLSANLVFKLSASGVIEEIIQLPAEVNAKQQRFGFEGIAESNGKLVVAFQRAWAGETQPRIGVYDLAAKTWQFMFYPLDAVTSPNKGWVGLSEITALGNNRFVVIERDNQGGPDARVKKLYRIDLTGVANGATLTKTLMRDVLPDLRKTNGLVVEKIEGFAVLANGDALLVNDNDGVDENNGETWLFNLGKLNLN